MNEDVVYADDEKGLYLVVDGMGGYAGGERAAAIAKERVIGRLERSLGPPEQRVREAIALANLAICQMASQNREIADMACVLTVALVEPSGDAVIGHVGDSRLYKLCAGTLRKVTKDHSPVGELEDSGQLTEAEAMGHPRRNEVFRDVGSAPRDPDDPGYIDIYKETLGEDCAFLICSDGLTDALTQDEIKAIVEGGGTNLDSIANDLIAAATNKGNDNVSMVFVAGQRFGAARPRDIEPASPVRTIGIPLISACLGVFIGVCMGVILALGTEHPVMMRRWSSAPRSTEVRPGSSITEALSQAAAGSTVRILPGTYRESVRIGKSLTLDAAGAVIIPPEHAAGFVALTISNASVIILNLRIRGLVSGNLKIGVKIRDAAARIEGIDVTNAAVAGLDAEGSSRLIVTDSRFLDGAGPGIVLNGSTSASLLSNFIVGNGRHLTEKAPGIEIRSGNPITIRGNTIVDNGGGAIWTRLPLPGIEALNNLGMTRPPALIVVTGGGAQ